MVDVDIIKSNMRTVGMSREQYFDLLNKTKLLSSGVISDLLMTFDRHTI